MTARLSFKYYIIAFLFCFIVVLGWYCIVFLNTNEILMEDDTPMDPGTKIVFTVLMSVILLSWTMSLIVVLRQMISGYAFYIDDKGIHSTASVSILLSLILVVPIKLIPYEAIQHVSEKDGALIIRFDKARIQMLPILRPLARNEFRFFFGFTKAKNKEIKDALDKYIKK